MALVISDYHKIVKGGSKNRPALLLNLADIIIMPYA